MKVFFCFACLALPLHAQVEFISDQGQIAVQIDGKPYTTFFLAADGNKPYLYPLRTAEGVNVTRRFPMEAFPGESSDHPHQRGMFFCHGDINGVNFWATELDDRNPRKGRMVLKKILEATGGKQAGILRVSFTGLDPRGQPLMNETRQLVFHAGNDVRIIDFSIEIEALVPLRFADTKEGTFGIRVATSMQENKGGRMVNAEGGETEKEVWGKRSAWLDYSGPVDGQMAGITVMDHPTNPRHPTYWHARAYGLLGANIFAVHDFERDRKRDGSLSLAAGKTLQFRYRIVIHRGDARALNLAALYHTFAAEK